MKNLFLSRRAPRALLLFGFVLTLFVGWLTLAFQPLTASFSSADTTAIPTLTPIPTAAPASEIERLRAALNLSEARRLAAQSRLLYKTEPYEIVLEGATPLVDSLLLAVEAYKRVENDDTRDALLSALANSYAFTDYYTSTAPVQIAYSDPANRIAVAERTGEINLFEFPTGKPVGQLTGQVGNFTALQFSPDGKTIASGSRNGSVHIWDVTTGETIRTIVTGDTNRVLTLAFSPDNQTLITSGLGKIMRRWNLATGQPIGEPTPLTNVIGEILYSPDGKTFATANGQEQVLIGTVADGQLTPLGVNGAPEAFSPDGTRLAVSSSDPVLQVWDLPNRKQLYTLPAGEDLQFFSGVFFNADGQTLTVIVKPFDIRVLDAKTGKQRYTGYYVMPAGTFTLLLMQNRTVYPSSENIPGFSYLPQDHVWHPGLYLGARGANDARFSPDGKWLAARRCLEPGPGASCGGFTLALFDVAARQTVDVPIDPKTTEVYGFAFKSGGSQLALSLCRAFDALRNCTSSELVIWDLVQKKFVSDPLSLAQPLGGLLFSPDGKQLITANKTNNITIWDIATGLAVGAPLEGHADFITSLVLSPDGKMLASSSADKTIRLWDLVNHSATQILTVPGAIVEVLQFSPDGKTLAAAYGDATIRLWNVANGQTIGAPWIAGNPTSADGSNPVIPPTSLAFSSNGKYLAAGQDDQFSLWDVAQAKLLRRWNAEGSLETTLPTNYLSFGGLGALTFQNNDTQIWTVTRNGTVRQIDLAKLLQSPVDRACARLNRNLSVAEWTQYLANGIDTYEKYREHPTCANAPVEE